MEPLAVLQALVGFALVLFIPGFALTLALWPRTKGEVYREVLGILREAKASEVHIVGSSEEAGELVRFLRDGGIKAEVLDTGKGKVYKDGLRGAMVLVLMEDLKGRGLEIEPRGRLILDLRENLPEAKKVEDTIDGVERLALSFGLSVAIAPLLGILLDKTPFGIRLWSVTVSLLILTVLLLVYAHKRRAACGA